MHEWLEHFITDEQKWQNKKTKNKFSNLTFHFSIQSEGMIELKNEIN